MAQVPLRVCLQADDPPLSSQRDGVPAGFDVALARTIAARLGESLQIQWFTTPDDPDSNPMTEADALLSDGHCALVAGYPLVADKLGRPRAGTGKLPPFGGAKPEDRRRWVTLGELAPTRAYRSEGITVALSHAEAQRAVASLAALRGLRIGVVTHGLPDLIAMSYHDDALAQQVVHFDQSHALFTALGQGDIDAALVDQRELDAWRLAHPDTAITPSGYRHSIRFNIGFIGLATSNELIGRIDAILAGLLANGSLGEIAHANGMTWLPPGTPNVSSHVPLGAVRGD